MVQVVPVASCGGEVVSLDTLPPLNEYGAAVRSGIRVAHRVNEAPRVLWGGDQQQQVKVRDGIPDAALPPEAATAKAFSGLFAFRAAVKAHVVMGSQGARTPEQPELLAALYSRGDQNRVSGYVGFESASQGRGPMRTVAQQPGNQISHQRRHGVSPRLSLDKLCPEKGDHN